MPTITNQASLRYSYNGTDATALSNVATAELMQPLTVAKTSLETTYRAGEELTYILSLSNTGTTVLNNVTVQDDLGTFTTAGVQLTPLDFVPDALLFIGGVNNGVITPTAAADSITFTIPALPAGTSAQIIYKVQPNGYAPLIDTAEITNTAVASADGLTDSVTDSYTVTAGSYADVAVFKTMSPANVSDGGLITYTFDVTNRGNAPAENIVLTDAFDPAPTAITVSVNGTVLPATDYTYTGGVLTVPAGGGDPLSLPAATITTDPTTGAVTVTPSSLTITVTGTL